MKISKKGDKKNNNEQQNNPIEPEKEKNK